MEIDRRAKTLEEVRSVIDGLQSPAETALRRSTKSITIREFWNGYIAALKDVKERIVQEVE